MSRPQALLLLGLLAACADSVTSPVDWREVRTLPATVTVRAVFFVPQGEAQPTGAQRDKLSQHLVWARQRYIALLGSAGAFQLDTAAIVVAGAQNETYYEAALEQGAPAVTAELLERFERSRWANPWVFVIVRMNADADLPTGGGRPINGGFNSGGGIVVLSSYALDTFANFQSTLRHELGHAFGLVHVELYGRDMQSDSSLMSYNPAHHTNGFTDSPTPGVFAWEDRKALSLNQRVFPGLGYAGPEIPLLYGLPPMTLPGHPDYSEP